MNVAVDILEEHENPAMGVAAASPDVAAWQASDVQKGLDDLKAGRVLSQEDVERRLREKGFRV